MNAKTPEQEIALALRQAKTAEDMQYVSGIIAEYHKLRQRDALRSRFDSLSTMKSQHALEAALQTTSGILSRTRKP